MNAGSAARPIEAASTTDAEHPRSDDHRFRPLPGGARVRPLLFLESE